MGEGAKRTRGHEVSGAQVSGVRGVIARPPERAARAKGPWQSLASYRGPCFVARIAGEIASVASLPAMTHLTP